MTDRAQFEAMLEALINEDQETAKEIFHNIVVAKSREIYEELLAEDFSQDQGNPYKKEGAEEEEEEGSEEEEEGKDDGKKEENPFGGEDDGEEDDDAEDGEEGDDGEDDGEDDDFGGDEGEEGGEDGDIEDRVMDLEDALEDLKAEFEQLLSQEEDEGGHDIDAIHHAGGEDGDMGGDMGGAEHGGMDELDELMEYTIKVSPPKHGDDGVNKKSTIDNFKNDMGGTTANIAQSHSETKGGTQGGLASPKVVPNPDAKGNINVPGGKAGKTGFTKREPGHGAEKKSTGDNGANKTSLIKGRVR
jgi:hypothetical protein